MRGLSILRDTKHITRKDNVFSKEYWDGSHKDNFGENLETLSAVESHDYLPSQLGDGDKWIEKVYSEEKNIFTGPIRAAKAGQKSLVPAQQAEQTNQGMVPFNCTLWVPSFLSLNSQQGPALSILSVTDLQYIYSVIDPYETYSFIFLSAEQAYKRIQIPMTIES